MMTYTLVMLATFGLARADVHTIIVPGFSTQENCMAAAAQIKEAKMKSLRPDQEPNYIKFVTTCVVVK